MMMVDGWMNEWMIEYETGGVTDTDGKTEV